MKHDTLKLPSSFPAVKGIDIRIKHRHEECKVTSCFQPIMV
jgi:hypothetical protein